MIRPGDAISIRLGDNTHLDFYRDHCVKAVTRTSLRTWCGRSLQHIAVGEPKGGKEAVCEKCLSALMEVSE
jgi:hypothetical protein